jgi:hypothetical protein
LTLLEKFGKIYSQRTREEHTTMKQLTISEMRNNLTLAIEDEARLAFFEEQVKEYEANPRDHANRIMLRATYENLMLVYALQNIANADERITFYIENKVSLDYAEEMEFVIVPLLEKQKREGTK